MCRLLSLALLRFDDDDEDQRSPFMCAGRTSEVIPSAPQVVLHLPDLLSSYSDAERRRRLSQAVL